LLLRERDPRCRTGLLMRKEMGIGTGARNIGRRAVRKPQVGVTRRDRHGPSNQAGLADLAARETTYIIEPSGPEIGSTHPRNTIGYTRVSVDAC
jgi:hypothetical protein